MQINLKQNEVTAGVRAYIAAQGISLEGKEFTVKYTAGRGTDGLTAEVEILNKDLPDLVDEDSAEVATTAIAAAASVKVNPLKVVKADKKDPANDKAPEPQPAPAAAVSPTVDKEVAEAAPTGGEVQDPVVEQAPAPTAKPAAPSLFS